VILAWIPASVGMTQVALGIKFKAESENKDDGEIEINSII